MHKNTLYVHIPFCERKCFYCSFVIAVAQKHRMTDYLEAISQEAAGSEREQDMASVYIGGGTPSLLEAPQLNRLFDVLARHYTWAEEAEVTLEANPDGLTSDRLSVLRRRGVTRVSLGIQSLQDRYLRTLGRIHDAQQARAAFTQLQEQGFSNISVDLMFGFPGQTQRELEEDIRAVAALGAQHVSLYSLMIEKNSRFFARGVSLPPPERQEEEYATVVTFLEKAGYVQYEVSNFARPGFESVHNCNYWQGGNYTGLGVGAHSHHEGVRSWNVDRFSEYCSRIREGVSPRQGQEQLTPEQRLKESFWLGLRMVNGIDAAELQRRFGWEFSEEDKRVLSGFVDNGLLVRDGAVWRTSFQGRMCLDTMAGYLI